MHCRFKVRTVTEYDQAILTEDRSASTGKNVQEVCFLAVYDRESPEGVRSSGSYLPSGELKLTIRNPEFVGKFVPGQYCSVDIMLEE